MQYLIAFVTLCPWLLVVAATVAHFRRLTPKVTVKSTTIYTPTRQRIRHALRIQAHALANQVVGESRRSRRAAAHKAARKMFKAYRLFHRP